MCDVRKVEFARALRLTTSTVEPMSFSVPRTRVSVIPFFNCLCLKIKKEMSFYKELSKKSIDHYYLILSFFVSFVKSSNFL